MIFKRILPLVVSAGCLLLASSCAKETIGKVQEVVTTENGVKLNVNSLEQNTLRLRVSEDFAARLEKGEVDISKMGLLSASRTFPDAGVFEVRSRKAGLHLWYDVTFDMPLTKAGAAMSDIPGVDLV